MLALVGMAVLSAATLAAEVSLTRVFSIAQYHHFAFLLVSLALLGFAASGSLLAAWPRLQERRYWPMYALSFAVSLGGAYLFVDHLPFDSYAIAWDGRQAGLLVADLLALAVPFTCAGALIGAMLVGGAAQAGRVYAANLLGSAAGIALALLALDILGSERLIVLCAGLGAISALLLAGGRTAPTATASILAVGTLVLLVAWPSVFEIEPSAYKRLSQFRLDPDARVLFTRQDATARLDAIEASTIHSAPGLSPNYMGTLPPQVGLLLDGDLLLPVLDTRNAPSELARALPSAIGHRIRSGADVLLLGAGGWMEEWAALANGARQVTVVEPSALVLRALTDDLAGWTGLGSDPRVRAVRDDLRSFARRTEARFDLVELTLSDGYRPVTSGAYSLTETYSLTIEAFRAYLRLLEDDGIFIVTRWLQTPPSEDLRTLGLIVEALDGRPPLQHVVAFRSFQTVTFLVKATPFTAAETETLLEAIDELHYDLILAPRIPPEMVDRYARIGRPIYRDLALALVTAPDRPAFYAGYEFDIAPPTDDRPFFLHFFRWAQTPEILQNLGRRWQPFGGSGYFVLLALLAFACTTALVFVVGPIVLRAGLRRSLAGLGAPRATAVLGYFGLLGFAFMFVEITFIQRSILLLGWPALALTVILGVLLASSGLGSAISARVPWRAALVALGLLVAACPVLLGLAGPPLLALPLAARVLGVGLLVAPVGFLMGIPFARGIRALAGTERLVAWAWAANGGASVVGSVLAALLSLSFGFTPVLLLAAILYLGAAALVGVVTPAGTLPDAEAGA